MQSSKKFLQIYDLLFIPSEFFFIYSAIDFNIVNPSNNTFNRQKILITIFVNETKCIFEKNLKKPSKIDSKIISRLHSMSYNMPYRTLFTTKIKHIVLKTYTIRHILSLKVNIEQYVINQQL